MRELERITAFLSIPYGREHEHRIYWAALGAAITEVAKELESVELVIRSAENEVNALALKKSVSRQIDQCDFTVAVTTGRNPNIFWEIGYTEALGKPVVYLVDEETEDLAESPVLIAEALKCPYKASQLVDVATTKRVPEALSAKLQSHLAQAVKAVKATPRKPHLSSYANRAECDVPKLIAGADERIFLITSNMSYFSDPDGFVVEENGNQVFAFDPPVKKGVEVKILTMDPESPLVKYRAEQLKLEHDVQSYREELRNSARWFHQRYKDKKNVSIRLYDDLPLQISVIIDKKVVTSVMTRGSRSRKNPHFRMDLALPGAGCFEKHFSEVDAGPCRHISAFKWAGEG